MCDEQGRGNSRGTTLLYLNFLGLDLAPTPKFDIGCMFGNGHMPDELVLRCLHLLSV